MKVDLVKLYCDSNETLLVNGGNDEYVRVLLENAQEQGFVIIPFIQDRSNIPS